MKLILLALMTLAVAAQTSVKPAQMKAPAAAVVRLMAFLADGSPIMLELGDGVRIVDGKIVAIAAESPRDLQTLPRQADGTYAIPEGMVFRNGIAQLRGTDYTISQNRLVTRDPWDAADLVTHAVKASVGVARP